MYCLQWLLPVLMIPRAWVHPSFLYQQSALLLLYLLGFFLERKPCYICTLIFLGVLCLLCLTDVDACLLLPFCRTSEDGERCLGADA